MAPVNPMLDRPDDLRKKILIIAAVILALMILFPPKYIVHHVPILGTTSSQSVGYHFLLNDPAASEKAAIGEGSDQLVSSGIEWGKLFLQIVIVAGVAYGAMRFMAGPPPRGTGAPTAPTT